MNKSKMTVTDNTIQTKKKDSVKKTNNTVGKVESVQEPSDTIESKDVDSVSESTEESNKLEEAIKNSNFNIKNLEELYKQNLLLKQQIDRDKMILKKARENFKVEINQKYKELNQYKNDMNAIIEKSKNEISAEYEQLSKHQDELDKDRKAFEALKKKQQTNFKLRNEKQQSLLETKQSELESIELDLKLKKEQIESLRKKLELDIKEFETKKQELTNNLNRFNSLVSTIGRGMDKINETTAESEDNI